MNKNNTVNYTGVTNDLTRRIFEHKTDKHPLSYASKYNINKLVYFEEFHSVRNAIAREKEIKGWVKDKIGMTDPTLLDRMIRKRE